MIIGSFTKVDGELRLYSTSTYEGSLLTSQPASQAASHTHRRHRTPTFPADHFKCSDRQQQWQSKTRPQTVRQIFYVLPTVTVLFQYSIIFFWRVFFFLCNNCRGVNECVMLKVHMNASPQSTVVSVNNLVQFCFVFCTKFKGYLSKMRVHRLS